MTRLLPILVTLLALAACDRDRGETAAGASAPGLERAVADVEAARADAAVPPPLPEGSRAGQE